MNSAFKILAQLTLRRLRTALYGLIERYDERHQCGESALMESFSKRKVAGMNKY